MGGLTSTGVSGGFFAGAAGPIAGAALDAIGSVGGGLFAANQARKNRKFQERMYKQQLADNRENWRLQNEYNLPKNELARILDAGLNPLLYYQNGANGGTAVAAPQGASAPHGDSAKLGFNTAFGQAFQQAALLRAQVRNLESNSEKNFADAEKAQSETEGQNFMNWLNDNSRNVQLAIKFRDLDYLNSLIRKQDQELLNSTHLTFENVRTMAQNRLYQIKQFQLSEERQGQELRAMWENVASGKISANAAWKNACAAMLNAVVNEKFTNAQIGAIGQQVLFNWMEQPFKLKALRLQNRGLQLDNKLKKVGITNENIKSLNSLLRLQNLDYFGSEEISSHVAPVFLLSGKIFGRKGLFE